MLTQSDVASVFRCQTKFVRAFERQDPFNKVNTVAGFINRKKGLTGGSLLITSVNGKEVEPQLIYGTPKLAYPYKPNSTDYIDLDAPAYYLAEKWNGVNILFFKYRDADGKVYISAKSKGSPFLANLEFGNFLDLTDECFGDVYTHSRILGFLEQPGIEALSCELCGKREPHLAKYSFDIDLKPLFTMGVYGQIRPIIEDITKIVKPSKPGAIVEDCKQMQELCFNANEQYRITNNLPIKYEHDHFLTEGKVLYLLDKDGFVPGRTLFKIKPRDIEECHWERFEDEMEARVKEAVEKVLASEESITEETLRAELDCGPKEWSKWKRQAMKIALGDNYGKMETSADPDNE